jgi:hypothetical protein
MLHKHVPMLHKHVPMLHKHEVDIFQHTQQSIDRHGADLPDHVKVKFERSHQIVKKFYARKIAEQMGAYADAIGSMPCLTPSAGRARSWARMLTLGAPSSLWRSASAKPLHPPRNSARLASASGRNYPNVSRNQDVHAKT